MAHQRAGRILGLIPAKGGSTRLARKNLRLLAGRSLLAWAVEAARASGVLERIVVSTEDQEVVRAARGLGVDVPFLRPPELARDPAGVADVALHALTAVEEAEAYTKRSPCCSRPARCGRRRMSARLAACSWRRGGRS